METQKLINNVDKVKFVLNKNEIKWELGSEMGLGKNTIIFNGVNDKILVHVKEDRDNEGGLFLSYYHLFLKGEYSPTLNCKVLRTTTIFRGNKKCVGRMLKELGLKRV